MKAYWVFDVISPFAYLGSKQLALLPTDVDLTLVPVLFAGLLNHHGQVGNAEIESKRRFTYRFAMWRARKMNVPMRLPPAHPFNPLHALRLVVGASSTRHAAETALDFVFQHGRDVTDPDVLADLAKELGIPDARAVIEDERVKQRLRDNTDWAIKQGVFGVPTFVIDGELFWGHDAFDMVLDYFRDPGQFADAEMRRIDDLPVGVVRTRKPPSQLRTT